MCNPTTSPRAPRSLTADETDIEHLVESMRTDGVTLEQLLDELDQT